MGLDGRRWVCYRDGIRFGFSACVVKWEKMPSCIVLYIIILFDPSASLQEQSFHLV